MGETREEKEEEGSGSKHSGKHTLTFRRWRKRFKFSTVSDKWIFGARPLSFKRVVHEILSQLCKTSDTKGWRWTIKRRVSRDLK